MNPVADGSLVVSLRDDIAEIPRASLTPFEEAGGLYWSYDWLRYCHRSAEGAVKLLTAHRRDQLVGLAPIREVQPGRVLSLYDLEWFLGEDVGVAVHPSVVCALSGAAPPLLVHPRERPTGAQAVRARLGAGLSEMANETDQRTFGALYMECRRDAEDAASLWRTDASIFMADMHAAFHSEWTTFDGYVASLPPSRRTGVRKERRRYLESGLTTNISCGTSSLDRDTAALQVALRQKYGAPGDVDSVMRDYDNLAQTVNDKVVVVRSDAGQRPVGMALFLMDGDKLHARLAGFDYSHGSGNFTYFNILFYEAILWGLANGITYYDYGTGTYEAKQARGCSLYASWAAVAWPESVTDARDRMQAHETRVTQSLAPASRAVTA